MTIINIGFVEKYAKDAESETYMVMYFQFRQVQLSNILDKREYRYKS